MLRREHLPSQIRKSVTHEFGVAVNGVDRKGPTLQHRVGAVGDIGDGVEEGSIKVEDYCVNGGRHILQRGTRA